MPNTTINPLDSMVPLQLMAFGTIESHQIMHKIMIWQLEIASISLIIVLYHIYL